MKTAGKKIMLYRYEAGHGFANPSNPSYNKEYTQDAYSKAIAFWKRECRNSTIKINFEVLFKKQPLYE